MASWPGAQTRTAQLQPSPKTSGSWTLSGQVVTSSAWRSMPRQVGPPQLRPAPSPPAALARPAASFSLSAGAPRTLLWLAASLPAAHLPPSRQVQGAGPGQHR